MQKNEKAFLVSMMCRLLTVSRGHYYSWKTAGPSARQQANAALAGDIKTVFEDHRGRAGAPRITKLLRAQGQSVGHNRVARLMRKNGLRAKAAKKYKATTNSNHNLPVAPNLLEQHFEAAAPDQKYVSDIMYIWTDEGWLYSDRGSQYCSHEYQMLRETFCSQWLITD